MDIFNSHNDTNSFLTTLSLFFVWLYTMVGNHFIGFLTVIVLILSGLNFYYNIRKTKMEIKKIKEEKRLLDEKNNSENK